MRALVIEDHAIVRQGLVMLLRESARFARIGEASNAAEARELIMADRWDVALLDISLGESSGMELLRELRVLRPQLPIVVLSMHPAEHYAVRALREGASAYVEKSDPPDHLIEAVLTAARRRRYITPRVAELLASELTVASRDPHERLTAREFEVFIRLAAGRTVSEIAEELVLSVKTVSTYRTRIIEKTGLRNNAEMIQYAMRRDLV
ncbi:MAG TPA: response regulator transcription factor [Thermoanaerobaculia bacterium]|nr:response regulator transcription factor [Thermoanaerobaculia bacterium]